MIDDILGLLVLAVVSSMAAGAVNYVEILTTAALAIGFTVFMAFVAARLSLIASRRVLIDSEAGMECSFWVGFVPGFIRSRSLHWSGSNHRFFFGRDGFG